MNTKMLSTVEFRYFEVSSSSDFVSNKGAPPVVDEKSKEVKRYPNIPTTLRMKNAAMP